MDTKISPYNVTLLCIHWCITVVIKIPILLNITLLIKLCHEVLLTLTIVDFFTSNTFLSEEYMQSSYLNSPFIALVCVHHKLDWYINVQVLLQFKQVFLPWKTTFLKFNNLSTGINLENKKFNSVPALSAVSLDVVNTCQEVLLKQPTCYQSDQAKRVNGVFYHGWTEICYSHHDKQM